MDAFFTKLGQSIAKAVVKAVDAIDAASVDSKPNAGRASQAVVQHTSEGLYLEDKVLVGIDPGVVSIEIGPEVNEIAENAFNQGVDLEEIVFKGDLERIGARAFCSLPKLRRVCFEASVYEINDEAFRGCEALETVEFCDGMYKMGDRVFQDCTALVDIWLADDLLTMGKAVFSGCYQVEHIHLPKALRVIPAETFEDCTLLESIDWPVERRYDGHDYPVVAPFAFRGCLSDDYWEKFELHNGVMQRTFVNVQEVDPVGLFNMMLPGETRWIDWVPQRIVYGILNLAWESSALNSQQLAFKMQVYQVCMGLVNLLVIRENGDNRAERLVVLHQIKLLLLRVPDLTVAFVRHVLPHAISVTLGTISGNGKNRRLLDSTVAQLFEAYRDEYIQVQKYNQSVGDEDASDYDEDGCNYEDCEGPCDQPIFQILGIGDEIPFRYDTTRYMDVMALSSQFDDYYIFARAMESLCSHRFGTSIHCDQDLGRSSHSEWFSAWAKLIDQWDNDFALVVVKPSVAVPEFRSDSYYRKKLQSVLNQELNLVFVAILHRAQIEAMRGLLSPYRMEDIIQVYSYSLEMI